MNDFRVNDKKEIRRRFNSRISLLLFISFFLTGFFSISGIWFLVQGIPGKWWEEMGASTFAWRVLQYLCAFSILIALIRIALSETPFSKTLTVCLWWIGGLFIAASVIFTRLPGYVTSGFRLFTSGDFTLVDAGLLLPGLLLVILGSFVKMGFEMQKEIDEIL